MHAASLQHHEVEVLEYLTRSVRKRPLIAPECMPTEFHSSGGVKNCMQPVKDLKFCVQKQADLSKKRDAERSEREEMEARLKIDNEERMRRLATFQELASNRMAIQQQHLGPLMVNLKQSHAELTEAENLQVLNLLHSCFLLGIDTGEIFCKPER